MVNTEVQLCNLSQRFLVAAVNDPSKFAVDFQQYLWGFEGSPHPIAFNSRNGDSGVLLNAGHAVTHYRNGEVKIADLFTGPVVVSVGERTKSVYTLAANLPNEDPNYDPQSNYRAFLASIADSANPWIVLDIHGAKANQGFDVTIGTSGKEPNTHEALIVQSRFNDRGFDAKVMQTGPFSASQSETLTRYFLQTGRSALQIELSRSLRSPDTDPQTYIYMLHALSQSVAELAEYGRIVTRKLFVSYPHFQPQTHQ